MELRHLVEQDTFTEADLRAFTGVLTPDDSIFEIAPVELEVALAHPNGRT